MQPARHSLFPLNTEALTITHLGKDSPRRCDVESFIRNVFAQHYGANVTYFAANLLLLEKGSRMVAAAGWLGADTDRLFLESYLDAPIEQAIGQLTGRSIQREQIVEVGNLAAIKPGGSLNIIGALASYLDKLGYEWVTFTATRELIGIFSRIGLPLLALRQADPACIRDQASQWGNYYDQNPVVVVGRIRLALDRMDKAI